MKELWPFIRLFRSHWLWLTGGALLGLVTLAAGIGLLSLAGWFISATALAGLSAVAASGFDIFRPGALIRFFALLRTAGRYGERLTTHEATFRLLAHLRVWFYQRLEPLAPARLLDYRSGDLLSRIVADIDALDNLYLRVLAPSAVAMLLTLAITALFWTLDPAVAVITGFSLLLGGFTVPALAERLGRQPGAELALTSAALRIRLVDHVQGLAELLAFGAHDRHLADIKRTQDELFCQQARMQHLAGCSAAALTLISGLAVTGALYLALGALERGTLSGTYLAVIALGVLAAFEVVMPLPLAYQFLGRTRAAARRLLAVVNSEPAVVFPPRSASAAHCFDVIFENVDFAYRDKPVLRQLNLRIAHGERVAILGPTGSGKSTLAQLLARFRDPDAGRILIGGIDIREFEERQLRAYITVLDQRPHLFNARIRDNLLLARPDADDETLRQALASTELLEFVDSLPEGLDTWIGEAGAQLSGGQARRLALTRVLLKKAPIVVLDEPGEGLDRATADKVLAHLWKALAGRSVLLITHQVHGFDALDSVHIMDDGKLR